MTTMTATRAEPAAAIQQYSLRQIVAIWAAAALPMAALSWLIAPALADHLAGPNALTRSLIVCLTGGLIWQFALVMILVGREQRTLRWSAIRPALWLQAPTGGKRAWWLLVPLILASGAEALIPTIAHPDSHDFGVFLGSDAGQAFLSGNWAWFAIVVALVLFNTVLGEELLFRGLLLPRMNGAFGERDWVANGVLFACYHLHVPWAIPATLLDTFIVSLPAKRRRSALLGIAVHSAQSVFILIATLALVLR
jgi:membrane protease YdiL (CAAX protease family)